MSEDQLYLTVALKKRQPENDGYLAVISQGNPQLGDKQTTVLTVEVVENMEAARRWFKQQCEERPWEEEIDDQ